MGRIGDSRRPVHAQPDVVVSAERCLARVHSHPDSYASAFGPGRLRQGTLGLHGCADRVGGLGEDGEERIPLGRELMALGAANGFPENRVVAFEDWRVAIP